MEEARTFMDEAIPTVKPDEPWATDDREDEGEAVPRNGRSI